MNKSDSIVKLAKALLNAQAEFEKIPQDARNPFFNSMYSTLGSVIKATKPIMQKNGLAISQLLIAEDGAVGVETILMHESGEWISSATVIPLPPHNDKKSMAQAAGIYYTYLRRYGYMAVLGVYSDDDDDGQGLVGTPAPKKEKPLGDVVAELAYEKVELNQIQTAKVLNAYKVETGEDIKALPDKELTELKSALEGIK